MKTYNRIISYYFRHIVFFIFSLFVSYRVFKYLDTDFFVIWFDSAQYAAVSLASLWSKEFWSDGIPPLYPFYLKYFHQYYTGSMITEINLFSLYSFKPEIIKGIEIMPDVPFQLVKNNFDIITASLVQTSLSISCWLVFAYAASQRVNNAFVKLITISLVLLLGSESSVVLWDKHILTESMTISLLLLLISILIYIPEHINKNIVVVLLILVLFLISFIKITNNYFLLLLLPFTGFIYWQGNYKNSLQYGLIIATIISLFSLNQYILFKGDRTHVPMKDLISSRISTEGYEDIYQYFRNEGMPEIQHELIAKLWTAPFEKYPELHEWWLTKSSKTYQKYLITHPDYFFIRPFQHKNSLNKPVYHFFTPDIHHYEKVVPDKLQVMFTDSFLWIVTTAIFIFCLIIYFKKFPVKADNIYLPLFILFSALTLYLIIWHADIGELDRHLIQCALMLRISLLMLLVLLFDVICKEYYSNKIETVKTL